MKLTDEQQHFIDEALTGSNILVDACIGSGKTTAIQHLCNVFPQNKNILYLTYNKLLKIDAQSKIKRTSTREVLNYNGFAYKYLIKMGVHTGISDQIQTFVAKKPAIPKYDVLILDEYQDINLEVSKMLEYIKSVNPSMQIIAVGDMKQKIYDWTTLNISEFISKFLGVYSKLTFSNCFRLPVDHADFLGRVWQKSIHGVNADCHIGYMNLPNVIKMLKEANPSDVLCVGARTGALAQVLNILETQCPEKYNKNTTYASISDEDSASSANITAESAIFTTYDACKGLERKICVIFDFTEDYWMTRLRKPQQKYEILRNIFCVAASRGKEQIVFVLPSERSFGQNPTLLSEFTLSNNTGTYDKLDDLQISDMFDFKYKEDVENAFSLLKTERLATDNVTPIGATLNDGLIDLSPCVGIYAEASYFRGYDIDADIRLFLATHKDVDFKYTSEVRNWPVDKKILFLTALETAQNRYVKQVATPYIAADETEKLHERLSTLLDKDSQIQQMCELHFASPKYFSFSAIGRADAIKDDTVFELKFVQELKHEHFLQCACYMVALGLPKGRLWNLRNNTQYLIEVPDKKAFLDAVTKAITKGRVTEYINPDSEFIRTKMDEIRKKMSKYDVA